MGVGRLSFSLLTRSHCLVISLLLRVFGVELSASFPPQQVRYFIDPKFLFLRKTRTSMVYLDHCGNHVDPDTRYGASSIRLRQVAKDVL